LPALLAAPLTAAPVVTALVIPLDRIDAGNLVFLLLAFHHGDRPAMFVAVQGEQAVRSHRQPLDVILIVAF
jgi:hypothetical protein